MSYFDKVLRTSSTLALTNRQGPGKAEKKQSHPWFGLMLLMGFTVLLLFIYQSDYP